MADEPIAADSDEINEEDRRQRALVAELISKQNSLIVDFAKNLVTICFSAIGVILALRDKWISGLPDEQSKSTLLAVAIFLFLLAALISAMATRASRLRLSLSDYTNVEAELARLAQRRHMFTMTSTGLLIIGVGISALVVLQLA